MRRDFHPILLKRMRQDARIRVVLGDLGYKMFDYIIAEFPDRVHNVGAAEQLMLGVGVGMAEDNLIPVCFSITPFLLWRGAEWIRNYLNHENVPVKLLGGGRGMDYAHDGFTHDASDDKAFLSLFPNIQCYWPESVADLPTITHEWLYNERPSYLNLKR